MRPIYFKELRKPKKLKFIVLYPQQTSTPRSQFINVRKLKHSNCSSFFYTFFIIEQRQWKCKKDNTPHTNKRT